MRVVNSVVVVAATLAACVECFVPSKTVRSVPLRVCVCVIHGMMASSETFCEKRTFWFACSDASSILYNSGTFSTYVWANRRTMMVTLTLFRMIAPFLPTISDSARFFFWFAGAVRTSTSSGCDTAKQLGKQRDKIEHGRFARVRVCGRGLTL
jgi:hypothetical protein